MSKAVTEHNQSPEALKDAIAMKYQSLLSRRKFNFVFRIQNGVFDPNEEVWVPRNIKCLNLNIALPRIVTDERVDSF